MDEDEEMQELIVHLDAALKLAMRVA